MLGVLRSLAGARHRGAVSSRLRRPFGVLLLGMLGALAVSSASALLAGVSAVEAAPVPFRVIGKAGDWEAFAGILPTGKKVCGITTKGNGRWIDIRYIEGDTLVTIRLNKDSWTITDGTKADVVMQLDSHKALNASASAVHTDEGAPAFQFGISSKIVVQFTKDFVGSKALTVHFPKDTQIEDWQADITASQQIAQKWASCLSAMDNVDVE